MNVKPSKSVALRILNTRPSGQNSSLSTIINSAGGQSIELPAITIEPVHNWMQHLPSLNSIKQAIFISPNSVNLFFDALKNQRMNWPSSIAVMAIGKTTEATLESRGIKVECTPSEANSEGLIQLPMLQAIKNETVLVVKGEGGRPLIGDTLHNRGAKVVMLDVYRRTLPNYSSSVTDSLWQDDSVDIILFTSQQAIDNLFALFNEKAHAWLKGKPCVVISERIAEKAASIGMKGITITRYDELPHTLKKLCEQKVQDNP